MNKLVLTLAIFAFCLFPQALSQSMRANNDRELGSIKAPINLGNIGTIIGGIIGGVKNATNNTTNTTAPANNNTSTNSTAPANNSTSNTTTPANNSTNTTVPANNNTSTNTTIPANNSTSNTTAPSNNTSSGNNTSSNNSTTNSTTPAESDASDGVDESDSDPTNTTTPVTPPVNNNWYARNDVDRAAFKQKCLDIHNILRDAVGVAPVTWSDSLAASAQAWADNMAVNGFRHSGRTGENIASTTYSTKVTVRLLGLWTKEQDWYIKGCKYPKCSSNGQEVGHYTQMVWQKTTQVGCGFAPGVNRQWNYLCCQYYRAGNVIGQYVYPYTAPAV